MSGGGGGPVTALVIEKGSPGDALHIDTTIRNNDSFYGILYIF